MTFADRHGLTPRRITGSAGEIHERPMEAVPLLEVVQLTRPAVVLGSAQRDVDVDATASAAAGSPDLVRRRGGGGAVWVAPDAGWWFDVTVPRGDARWSDDVGAAFLWLGDALARWLDDLGLRPGVGLEVHRGSLVTSPWSSAVCFAGVGPGEVLVGGRKLVGISQRRTRDAARFMCWMPRVWAATPLDGLVLTAADLRVAAPELGRAGIGWDEVAAAPTSTVDPGTSDPIVEALIGSATA